MGLDPANKKIWEKFHIHGGDSSPMFPWLNNANRTHLAEVFGELGFRKGAEIGVRMGGFTRTMFQNNPGVEIFCVDPWAPYAKTSQERQDRYLRRCKTILAPYNAKYLIMTSEEALKHVPDDSLDFVYIDGLHDFDSVMTDIIGWGRKVKRGGIISGHDYTYFYQYGVIDAVNTYVKAHNIAMLYVTRLYEESPSWFFVKP
jgi:hypothetical protein